MVDQTLLAHCRLILIDTARNNRKIAYSKLASLLGVANQSVGKYLNEIYKDEIAKGHPDLTLVAVYSGTEYGNYNSRGARPQSFKIDPKNESHVRDYDTELRRVYAHPW